MQRHRVGRVVSTGGGSQHLPPEPGKLLALLGWSRITCEGTWISEFLLLKNAIHLQLGSPRALYPKDRHLVI